MPDSDLAASITGISGPRVDCITIDEMADMDKMLERGAESNQVWDRTR